MTCLFLTIAPIAADASQKTLGQIRKELLGQDVVILGSRSATLEPSNREPVFFDWYRAIEESPDRRRVDPSMRAAYSLKGRTARVVDIRASRLERQERPKDLFGDLILDDGLADPAFEIFLRAGDILIGTSTRYAKLFAPVAMLELAPVVSRDRRVIEQGLDALYGTALYPVGYSTVFPPDADLIDMTDVRRLRALRDVPNLTPLVIVKAKYVESEHAVLMKVEFGGGRSGLILSALRRSDERESLLDRVSSGFLTSLPGGLTDSEIDAIRAGVVVKGMSLMAVQYAWGFPDQMSAPGVVRRLTYKGRATVTMVSGKAFQVIPQR